MSEKPGHLMSLNDPKWRYLLISSINFSCKISVARLARAYQPSDFTAEKKKSSFRWRKLHRENGFLQFAVLIQDLPERIQGNGMAHSKLYLSPVAIEGVLPLHNSSNSKFVDEEDKNGNTCDVPRTPPFEVRSTI